MRQINISLYAANKISNSPFVCKMGIISLALLKCPLPVPCIAYKIFMNAYDAAVGGLHADHAAQRGGLADRAARIGAEARAARPAATAAADPPADPPGTRARSCGLCVVERRVLGGRAHRELVQVGLAEATAPASASLLHHGGVVRRPQPRGSSRSRWSGRPRAEVVLQRDRHARERAGPRPGRDAASTASAHGGRLVAEHRVTGVDLALAGLDRREVLLDHRARRALDPT